MTTEDIEQLWNDYKSRNDKEARDRLAEHYLPLVRRSAERLCSTLVSHADVEELFSAGLMGMMDAMSRYNPNRNIQFETFSAQRIRGAMLDDLRKKDFVPRGAREAQAKYRAVWNEFKQVTGRYPSDEEMMVEMDMDADAFYKLCREANISSMVPVESLTQEDEDNPEAFLPDLRLMKEEERADMREFLKNALLDLPERDRFVIVAYYADEMTLKEIAKVIEVTEGRVSQIMSASLARIRAKHLEAKELYL